MKKERVMYEVEYEFFDNGTVKVKKRQYVHTRKKVLTKERKKEKEIKSLSYRFLTLKHKRVPLVML